MKRMRSIAPSEGPAVDSTIVRHPPRWCLKQRTSVRSARLRETRAATSGLDGRDEQSSARGWLLSNRLGAHPGRGGL